MSEFGGVVGQGAASRFFAAGMAGLLLLSLSGCAKKPQEPEMTAKEGRNAEKSGEADHHLRLGKDQALVLLEFLARTNQSGALTAAGLLEDQAEERVLWDLEAQLETKVELLFSDDYEEQLFAARARVRDADARVTATAG